MAKAKHSLSTITLFTIELTIALAMVAVVASIVARGLQ
jgi:hypothetical protein